MTSFVYDVAKQSNLQQAFKFDATMDWRVLGVMSNSDAGGNTMRTTAQYVADLAAGTLDEFNGTNYSRITLTGETNALNTTTHRARFTADDFTWNTLGAGTRSGIGLVVYRFVTNDADSPIWCFLDLSWQGNTGNVTVEWDDTDGIWYF